ncbi:MAG: DNA polymerase Y family protein [Streptosporangiales bacterium]
MRTAVVWCPDWPVIAATRAAGQPPDAPVAVLDHGRVHACSTAARTGGVRRGMRTREAQARCPDLITFGYNQAVDAVEFEPFVVALESLVAGVEVVRPGVCALAARGPARYFGGEQALAGELRTLLASAGVPEPRVGIADGPFAAEQAARHARDTDQAAVVVPQGASAGFLAPLPVRVLGRPELTDLLRRLGIDTLGAFAALPAAQVLARFGSDGARAHQLAAGTDERSLRTRRPTPASAVRVGFDPPADRVDRVAFSARPYASRLVGDLAERGQVCTSLHVEIHTEREVTSRIWRHPRWFDTVDVVDRIRWQLSGEVEGAELTAGVVEVRLDPEETDRIGSFAVGLWGDQAPDERVHRTLTRVQGILGQDAVLTAARSGGRDPIDRIALTPWGDRAAPGRPADRPWPGGLPAPAPSRVFAAPRPAVVLAADGSQVGVTGRTALTAAPARFGDRTHLRAVAGWAGPWPVHERWWDERATRSRHQFQITSTDGEAWLLALEDGQWWVRGCYE